MPRWGEVGPLVGGGCAPFFVVTEEGLVPMAVRNVARRSLGGACRSPCFAPTHQSLDSNCVWHCQPPVLFRRDIKSRLRDPTRRFELFPIFGADSSGGRIRTASGCASRRSCSGRTEALLPRGKGGSVLKGRARQAESRASTSPLGGWPLTLLGCRPIQATDLNRDWHCQPLVLFRREIKSRLRRPNSEVGRSPYLAAAHQGTGFELRLAAPAAGLAPAGHLVLPPQAHSEVRILIRAEMRRAPLGVPSAFLVGARGFEPPTSRSRTERSTRLSHAPTKV